MAERIKADSIFLHLFCDNLQNPQVVERLLKLAQERDLLLIFEIAKNILENNITLNEHEKEELSEYETQLIYLSEKNASFRKKVKILKKSKVLLNYLVEIGAKFCLNRESGDDYSD